MKAIIFTFLTLFIATFIPQNAQALTVSPAKIELKADPGQTVTDEIGLFNEQNETKTFYISYQNFESRGDTGSPYFLAKKTGLVTWITTKPSITLAPGERRQVPYSITVPADARPGGHFAAIFFGSQPDQDFEGGEVAIGGRIGVLLLLRVSGDIKESAGLTSFGTVGDRRLFERFPVAFEYEFNNMGDDRVLPSGNIRIINTLQLTSANLVANEHEGNVLPNSSRRYEVVWREKQDNTNVSGFFQTALSQLINFRFGWYRAELNLTWGESGQTAQTSHNFFIVPWQLFSIVIPVLVVVWLAYRLWINRLKRKVLEEASKTTPTR